MTHLVIYDSLEAICDGDLSGGTVVCEGSIDECAVFIQEALIARGCEPLSIGEICYKREVQDPKSDHPSGCWMNWVIQPVEN